MMDYACVVSDLPKAKTLKSPCISWSTVAAYDPDAVLVGCCGFSLERNVKDAQSTLGLRSLRAAAKGEDAIFACDGNAYFAQPTHLLVHGCAILAATAYRNQPEVLMAIEKCHRSFRTPMLPSSYLAGWERVTLPMTDDDIYYGK